MNERQRRAGRLQFLLIAMVFLGPLGLATWLYLGSDMVPEGRSNRGVLLEPIISLTEALPGSATLAAGHGGWLLVYANPEVCADACHQALYTLRQARLMLGKDMDRLQRVFLHGATPPDTVFLAVEHAGLTTAGDAALMGLLDNKKPADLPGGGYYLVDPLGNLVMYFRPDLDPQDMVGDIRHLMQLSRIG